MNLSNRAKVALVLAILLVIAIILVFWFNRKTRQSLEQASPTSISGDIFAPDLTKTTSAQTTAGTLSPTATQSDQINYISPTPGKSATKAIARTPVSSVDKNGIRSYKVAITPAPNAGPYDWTRTNSSMTVIDASQSKMAGQSLCEIADLSESWSNIFEKSLCDLLNFLDQKLFSTMTSLTCDFTAGAIRGETGRPVSYKVEGGNCLIIDRQ